MSKEYAVMSARLECNHGTIPSNLVVLPNRTVLLTGKFRANIGDGKGMVNVLPFGLCQSKTNPAVIAAQGAPQPCTPTCSMWIGGKTDVLIEGKPALLTNDKAICPLGAGTIKVVNSGQGSSKTSDPPMPFEPRYGVAGEQKNATNNAGTETGNNTAVSSATTGSATHNNVINQTQLSAVESEKDTIANAKNKHKGNLGEMCTDIDVETNGPLPLDRTPPVTATRVGEGRVTGIDDPIQKGIDAIYKCDPPPPAYVVVESKYGSSQLSTTKSGIKQMDDDWIRDPKRIDKYFGIEPSTPLDDPRIIERDDFIESFEFGDVQKELSHIDSAGNVSRKQL